MPNSAVEIVNLALMKLGTSPIADFSDDTKAGLLARTSYETILEATLRAHPWNFSTRRDELPETEVAPLWGYDRSYDLPENPHRCLRVLEVNGEDPECGTWRVEGRQLLTHLETPIQIRYIWFNENVLSWDPLFVTALTCRLAAEWAESFARDSAYAQLKWEEFKGAIQEAWTIDGQEQMGAALEASSWINAR